MGMFDTAGGGLFGDLPLTQQQLQALQQRRNEGFLSGLANSGALDYTVPFISGKVPGSFAKGLAAGMGGAGEAGDAATLNMLRGNLLGLQGRELQAKIGMQNALANDKAPDMFARGGAIPSTAGPSTASPLGGGGMQPGADTGGEAPAVSSSAVNGALPPEARALLDSISGPESKGAYNARWPGKTFAGYSDHPRIFEPGPEGPSSAAGRYQIVASTWDPLAQRLGLTDFKPETQDLGAWDLAQTTYGQKTGRDLLSDLKTGDTSRVAGALSGQWATLKQGISSYPENLRKYIGADIGSPALADTASAVSALKPGQPQGGSLAYGGADYPAPPGSPADKQSQADALVRTPHLELSQAFADARNNGFNGTIQDFARQGGASPQMSSPRSLADTAAAVAALRPEQQNGQGGGGLYSQNARPAPGAGGMFAAPPVASGGMFAASPGAGPTSPNGAPQVIGGGGMTVSPQYSAWAQKRANLSSLLGMQVPAFINEAAALPFAGPKAAATAGGQYPFDIGKIREQANENIRAKLAESGMMISGNQIVRMPGFADVTTANARAKALGEQGPKVNEIRPGTMAATGDQIAANGGMMINTGEAGERGKKLADRGDLYTTEAKNAYSQNYLLDQMLSSSRGFNPGAGADETAFLKSLVNGVFPNAFAESLPSYQEFSKYAIQNAREQTRSMGAGEAASVFQTNIQANPNAKLTREGLESIIGGMHALNDYVIARDDAAAQWRSARGTMEGFDNSPWVKANPILKFKLPYMSTQELQRMRQQMAR